MKALLLNSGTGTRMGELTKKHPKCMTEIAHNTTILSRQLRQLENSGIKEVVITTGPFDDVLKNYCESLNLQLKIEFVKNSSYLETNYIYSLYCAKDYVYNDDVVLLHGDLVFEDKILYDIISNQNSCMVVSSTADNNQKDFKCIIQNGKILEIGVNLNVDSVAAQPLYKLLKEDCKIWFDNICLFCEAGRVKCYAEDAFNDVSDKCNLKALDIGDAMCNEIDTPEDLTVVSSRVKTLSERKVYMCFSTDIIHCGHIAIIKKAAGLGKLTIGVLSDEAVASYKRFPLLQFDERKTIIQNITGVNNVVEQKTLSYADILRKLKPAYLVHGDDWKEGFQKTVREEAISVLAEYGGQLIEFPYSNSEKYKELDEQARAQLSIPDIRRGRLRKLLALKPTISIIEAHSGITGLIAEKTIVYQDGKAHQFDGMWVSSLCDSTAKGKPDIELVDMSSRIRTIDDIMEVTTKPIILDGDTGGQIEHFVYNVRTLERLGVSAIIIEDKTGLKKNSLFGTEVVQTQDTIEKFSEKISAGKKAQKTKEFMIIARIESLILERGMEDALLRAFAFVNAGADGIMIHSRKKEPDEIFEFIDKFRLRDVSTPIVVVPTSFNTVTEEEFSKRGVNIIIYANQLTRSGFPAMQKAATSILVNHRAKEADDMCMSIKEILTLIPSE